VLLARGRPAEALSWLDEAVRRAAAGRFAVVEGYARKDRALAHLARGNLAAAEADGTASEQLFGAAGFAEGVYHARAALGRIRRAEGRTGEAAGLLREAAAGFEDMEEYAEAARACWDLARALRDQGADTHDALATALRLARQARRGHLAVPIARELAEAGAVADTAPPPEPADGPDGPEEVATVLAIGLQRQDRGEPAPDLLQARRHLVLDLAPALAAEGVAEDQDRADGLVAVARGPDHARRAVAAAQTAVRTVAAFNRPRRVLGWPPWQVHAGVATGRVCRGTAGPLDRPTRLTGGPAVDLAAALQVAARPGRPWINQVTQEHLAAHGGPPPGELRAVTLPGDPEQPAWELAGAEA
jgi:hypothetical protein